MLTAELRDDILTLQDLIGRDLQVWFAPQDLTKPAPSLGESTSQPSTQR